MNKSLPLLSKRSLMMRWFALSLLASPLIGAFFYSYSPFSSPFFCPFKALTGIPCPSCGLTRSFLAIAQGNFAQAIDDHLFGLLIFSSLLIGVIHLALEIVKKQKISSVFSRFVTQKNNLILILITFSIYYLVRLYNLELSGELINDFHHSPLGNLFS